MFAISEIKIYSRSTTFVGEQQTAHKCIVPVTDKCERSAQVMGDDYVKLSFNSATKLTLNAFDYIYYDGQFFFLKDDYTPKNIGSNGTTAAYYTYDVKFWSVANMLEKFAFIRHFSVLPEGASEEIECDEPEVELNGNLDVFGQLVGESLEYLYLRINSDNVQFRSIIQQLITRDSLGYFTNIVVKSDTDMVTVSFNGNFADFLTTITQQYTEPDKKVEWYITKDNVLHIDKCQNDSLLTLSDSITQSSALDGYRTGGLTSVEYAQEQNPLPQYIIPYGSDRNIESQMGQQGSINLAVSFGKRLRLDPNTEYTVEQGKTITTDSACRIQLLDNHSNPIINTGIELIKFYDDVYPQGHFCVDEVVEKFKTIDGVKQPRYEIKGYAVTNDYRGAEDYNAQHSGSKFIPKDDTRLQGVFPIDIVNTETLSINFESGFLNGREFEVANKTTKDTNEQGQIVNTYSVAFSIIADGDIKEGTLLPSGNCIPMKGDKFAIFNMVMPQYYITEAKKELAKACYKELQELYNTKPEIKCKTDEKEFIGMSMELGTQVLVTSLNLNVASDGTRSEQSRVIAFSHSLTHPNKIDFTLSSAISEGRLTGLETMIAEQSVQLSGTQQRAINLSKRGWRDQSEMADMLDSLKTEMMLVGEEKYQFGYTFGIECSQDMEGHSADTQTQFLHFTAGQIAHTQEPYISYANKGVWYLSEKTIDFVGTDETDLITNHPDIPYYVYAVCESGQINARIELCEQQKNPKIVGTDDDNYLLLGILSSEFEDNGTHFRVFNRTNGYTSIAGGTLTTEQIQDYNRNLIIDFQSNPPRIIARNRAQIIGNIQFLQPDGSTKTIEQVVEDIEIGGENLYDGDDIEALQTYKDLVTLNVGKYVLSADFVGNGVLQISLLVGGSSTTIQTITETSRHIMCKFEVTSANTKLRVSRYSGSMSLQKIMVQQGNKPTDYQDYVKHLADTFLNNARSGSTEVEGGLMMTNVLQLRNEQNIVTAGMSGLSGTQQAPENVLLWGGGTYADALSALLGGTKLPVLLAKSGFGSNIGCFNVVDKDTISVNNQLFITTKTIAQVVNIQPYVVKQVEEYLYRIEGNTSLIEVNFANTDFQFGSGYFQKGTYIVEINATKLRAHYSAEVQSYGTGESKANMNITRAEIVISDGTNEYTRSLGTISWNPGTIIAYPSTGRKSEENTFTLSSGTLSFTLESAKTLTFKLRLTGGYSLYGSTAYCSEQVYIGFDSSHDYIAKVGLINTTKYTIIGSDGIALIQDSKHYFYVYNNKTYLDVRMEGLPETASEEGQICLGEQTGDYKTLLIRHTPT